MTNRTVYREHAFCTRCCTRCGTVKTVLLGLCTLRFTRAANSCTHVPKTSRKSCSVHEAPMLATNSVQFTGCKSPPPTVSASEPGDIGFSEPAGLAISGLAAIDGWPTAVANAAVDIGWCPGGNSAAAGWNYTPQQSLDLLSNSHTRYAITIMMMVILAVAFLNTFYSRLDAVAVILCLVQF